MIFEAGPYVGPVAKIRGKHMQSNADIVYVIHPVTPKQKAAFNAKNLRIVDARFAPDGAEVLKPIACDEPVEADNVEPFELTPDAIAKMGKKEVRELLEAHGDTEGGTVAEMRDRLNSIVFISI